MKVGIYPEDVILNLDPAFAPFGAGPHVEQFTFPGGEEHVRLSDAALDAIPGNHARVLITARLNSSQALIRTLLLADAVKQRQVESPFIRLFAPYLPYARQDRVAAAGDPFSAGAVGLHLLATQCFREVIVFDPHSTVMPHCIPTCVQIPNHDFVRQAVGGVGGTWLLVCPDAGAAKKIPALVEALGYDREVVFCDKARDPDTGKLSGFSVKVPKCGLENRDLYIVDDICDGGGTFVGLARVLKATEPSCRLHLVVSHGIFSKGFDELERCFTSIASTNSWADQDTRHVREFRFLPRRAP